MLDLSFFVSVFFSVAAAILVAFSIRDAYKGSQYQLCLESLERLNKQFEVNIVLQEDMCKCIAGLKSVTISSNVLLEEMLGQMNNIKSSVQLAMRDEIALKPIRSIL